MSTAIFVGIFGTASFAMAHIRRSQIVQEMRKTLVKTGKVTDGTTQHTIQQVHFNRGLSVKTYTYKKKELKTSTYFVPQGKVMIPYTRTYTEDVTHGHESSLHIDGKAEWFPRKIWHPKQMTYFCKNHLDASLPRASYAYSYIKVKQSIFSPGTPVYMHYMGGQAQSIGPQKEQLAEVALPHKYWFAAASFVCALVTIWMLYEQ